MTPITGLPVAMRHGDDEQKVRLYAVKNGVRENSRQTAPHIVLQNQPLLRSRVNLTDGVLNRTDKPVFQTRLTPGVIISRLAVFSQSFGMKLIPYRANACRTCAKASSPGIVWTCPPRTSACRRRASASQS